MSSTTRGKTTGLDRYYTPPALARACLSTMGNLRGLRVWEPHWDTIARGGTPRLDWIRWSA